MKVDITIYALHIYAKIYVKHIFFCYKGDTMHILLTNDDGLWAPGIQGLAQELAKHHRVTMVAPKVEQSAKSSALTVQVPIRAKEMSEDGDNPRMLFVEGTPVDCVKFSLSYLLEQDRPDLVVSGINHGFNLGSDAVYSGTVGAALEGLMYGIPSLALSLEKYSVKRMEEVVPFIIEFIKVMYEEGKYKGLLNVNFLKEGPVGWEQVKVFHQGFQEYTNVIDVRKDSKGREYYWIVGDQGFLKEDKPTDVGYIKEGYISVVPLTWKQEDTEQIANVERLVSVAHR